MNNVWVIVLSYLAGSFPTALIMGYILKGVDIRILGSGNMGATNVFRQLGVAAGIVTLLLDMFKGFASAYWISRLGSGDPVGLMILAGVSAILGHTFTVFGGFRGGKGVATATGMALAIAPVIVLICALVFILTFLLTGYISVASMLAVSLFGIIHIVLYFLGYDISRWLLIFSIIIPFFIVWTHRSNVKKLRRGEEGRFENFMIFRRKKSS
ncbi:TPA: acyl-phosphate glycerol 3-phosphate acyltransferase [Candidatus Marinimicrobia bacterium]|nr:MAG: membrane protein [Marinimicrobia bacterium 46_43]HAE87052.1 acyl-phosphate glycerol 3-phosphate acyltransferase [Candidatus Neomarinimicrobiota bacterium]HBY18327.1 acyl-phosphate glycerol 3-phosphate acyltransferase [Candidatus Neomarinimicrobiota bacterium]